MVLFSIKIIIYVKFIFHMLVLLFSQKCFFARGLPISKFQRICPVVWHDVQRGKNDAHIMQTYHKRKDKKQIFWFNKNILFEKVSSDRTPKCKDALNELHLKYYIKYYG